MPAGSEFVADPSVADLQPASPTRVFVFGKKPVVVTRRPGTRFLAPLGLFAGFIDATGGGGWGPVATPTLISSGRLHPRKVIGSVSTSEFAVTIGASLCFLIGLGS